MFRRMLALLEVLSAIVSLFEIAELTTRETNRVPMQSALAAGLIVVLAYFLAAWTVPGEPAGLSVITMTGALVLAGLAAVGLLHAVRPIGEDFPRRTWSDSYRRCIGPLCLALLGAIIAVGCLQLEPWHGQVGIAAGVLLGATIALLGTAVAVHGARRPF